MKRIDLLELQSEGYLQEANRWFFHPLGLALCVDTDSDKNTKLSVLDAREDAEGFIFDFENRDDEYVADSITKETKVSCFEKSKRERRIEFLGSQIEPIIKL